MKISVPNDGWWVSHSMIKGNDTRPKYCPTLWYLGPTSELTHRQAKDLFVKYTEERHDAPRNVLHVMHLVNRAGDTNVTCSRAIRVRGTGKAI